MQSAPKAPDPYVTAAAQTQANDQSLAQASKYNQINEVGPYGNKTYTGTIGGPDRTVTTTLSANEQAKQNTLDQAALGLGSHVNNRLDQITDTPFSLSGLAGGENVANTGVQYQTDLGLNSNAGQQGSFDQGGALKYGIDSAGPINRTVAGAGNIQTSVGGADAATRNSVEDALYQRATSRLDPRFEQSDRALEAKLVNQGITQGSDAYTRAMADASRNKNDAYSSAQNDAILAGGQEQSRLFGLGLDQGNFANSAQAQQYGQNANDASFGNAAQAQQFGQNAAQSQFNNDTAGQAFGQNAAAAEFANNAALTNANFQNAAKQAQAGFSNDALSNQFNQTQQLRNQGIAEELLKRNQPINEIAALTSGSQVTQPTFGGGGQYSPQGVPIGDYINQNYQAQMANRNSLIGALAGAAGTAGGAALLCWVAREVMPDRWLTMREWMLTKAPDALHDFYMKHGPAIADFIRDKPELKARMRASMEAVLV